MQTIAKLVLHVVIALILSSCGRDQDAQQPSTSPQPSERAEASATKQGRVSEKTEDRGASTAAFDEVADEIKLSTRKQLVDLALRNAMVNNAATLEDARTQAELVRQLGSLDDFSLRSLCYNLAKGSTSAYDASIALMPQVGAQTNFLSMLLQALTQMPYSYPYAHSVSGQFGYQPSYGADQFVAYE